MDIQRGSHSLRLCICWLLRNFPHLQYVFARVSNYNYWVYFCNFQERKCKVKLRKTGRGEEEKKRDKKKRKKEKQWDYFKESRHIRTTERKSSLSWANVIKTIKTVYFPYMCFHIVNYVLLLFCFHILMVIATYFMESFTCFCILLCVIISMATWVLYK